MSNSAPAWSDDRVAELIRYWTAGESAGEIAKRWPDVTREAVCAKIARLGLRRGRPAAPLRNFSGGGAS